MRTHLKYVFAALILVLPFLAQAQISFGVKTGYHSSNVSIDGTGNLLQNTNSRGNFTLGAVAEIPLLNGFAFQPELTLKQKGFSVREGIDVNLFGVPVPLGVEAHTRLKYVEVPLLGKYKFGQEHIGAYVLAGPYFGYTRQANLRTKANVLIDISLTNTDIDLSNDDYNRWEAGAMAGIGFWAQAGNGQFFVDARYQHSISDMFNDPIVDVQMRNRGVEANVGYLWNF